MVLTRSQKKKQIEEKKNQLKQEQKKEQKQQIFIKMNEIKEELNIWNYENISYWDFNEDKLIDLKEEENILTI